MFILCVLQAPRSHNYNDTQYRPEGELYCTPSGEFANQRIANSDGHFVPYQYKVAGAPGPITNPNHINSPDSGIGDTLNASKYNFFYFAKIY